VNSTPNPPGTYVEPANFESEATGPPPPGDDLADEFYVGYKRQAPPRLAGFTRRSAWGLLLGGLAIASILVSTQERFDPGTFDFGSSRSFTGRVASDPYPVLSVTPPGAPDQSPDASRFVLVGFGKAGADREVDQLVGRDVELDGTLIYRDDMTMVEIVPGSATEIDVSPESPEGFSGESSLGVHTLTGEIVDLKCYLGVMKPGRGKPHRSCAVNCIRGGIPPVLVTGDGYYLLVDTDDKPVNLRVLDVVAEPIEITGEVVQKDNLYYLKAGPESYRRLTGT
jgi:hypothetical protein